MKPSLNFLPLLPLWSIGMIAAVLVLLLLLGSLMLSRKRVPSRSIRYLALLRLLAIGLLVACLFRPVLTYTSQDQRRPDLLMLVDTSQSMSVGEKAEGGNRLKRAMETMRKTGLEGHLASNYDVRWYGFDRDARPMDMAALAKGEAPGDGTDFSTSLQTAFRYHQLVAATDDSGTEAAPPEVVIVSDGNDRGSNDPGEAARRLGLRVHTFAPQEAAHTSTAPTCVIAGVQSPRKVLIGSECRFRVTLRQSNAGELPVVVELSEDGGEVARQEVVFGKTETERQINIAYRPSSVGSKQCQLVVNPKT